MSSNSLPSHNFSLTPAQEIAAAQPLRRVRATGARAKAERAILRANHGPSSKSKGFKVFHERRSSRTRRVSLAATPRPARAKASACDRVTMIARLACWLAIGGYLVVLSVELVSLYAA